MKKKICMGLLSVLLILLLLTACTGGNVPSEPAATEPSPAATTEKPTRLEIVTPPNRTRYENGDTFDPAGMVIQARYADGTVRVVEDYKIRNGNPIKLTDNLVLISYEGLFAQQPISVTHRGTNDGYSVAQTQPLAESVLTGKTVLWLGSSVTYGAHSEGESMADFVAVRNGMNCIKEAVSGTLLADVQTASGKKSYVARFKDYLAAGGGDEAIDAFICQLSTNDANSPEVLGEITGSDVRDIAAFDTATTFGAIEYLIATAQQTWDCPVIFYTNCYYEDANYRTMVDGLKEIARKWDIVIINLYDDAAFNDISEEDHALYMSDRVHPTRAGYREWWTPKFEEALRAVFTQ